MLIQWSYVWTSVWDNTYLTLPILAEWLNKYVDFFVSDFCHLIVFSSLEDFGQDFGSWIWFLFIFLQCEGGIRYKFYDPQYILCRNDTYEICRLVANLNYVTIISQIWSYT